MTARPRARRARCRRDERGQAAGVEAVPFGVLVFVTGVLLAVNVWSAVDARVAVDGAARDYLRAYTGAPDGAAARDRGRSAAAASLAARRHAATRATVTDPTEPFGPCRPATVVVEIDTPTIRAPFVGSLGTTTVRARRTELVQPHGVARDADDAIGPTPCDR